MGEDRNERRYIAEERAAVLDDEEVIFIIAGVLGMWSYNTPIN